MKPTQTNTSSIRKWPAMLLAAFAAVTAPATAQTTGPDTPQAGGYEAAQKALQYSNATYLAYAATASAAKNDEVREGLEALSQTLSRRTAIKPAGVVAVNLERDDLSFFPFLYLPFDRSSPTLSAAAQRQLQDYMNNGGFVLIERDMAQTALATRLGELNLGPVVEAENDHLLSRSFYIMENLPGIVQDRALLVQRPGPSRSEKVSPFVITAQSWAAYWAGTRVAVNTREREMWLRQGINTVMYAMTGHYKEDQMHMKGILERIKPAP